MKAACLLLLGISLSASHTPAASTNLLEIVRTYADTMLEKGRDTYGPQKSGLLLSALDRTTLAPLKGRPAPPGGIRRHVTIGSVYARPATGAREVRCEDAARAHRSVESASAQELDSHSR